VIRLIKRWLGLHEDVSAWRCSACGHVERDDSNWMQFIAASRWDHQEDCEIRTVDCAGCGELDSVYYPTVIRERVA
jgi:hypothetical protein